MLLRSPEILSFRRSFWSFVSFTSKVNYLIESVKPSSSRGRRADHAFQARAPRFSGLGTTWTPLHTAIMASTKDESQRLIYPPNVVHNSTLNSVKFLASCFTGAVAGILGLENWQGFAFFAASTLFTAACIYVVNCKGRPAKYLPGGVKELVNPGQDNVFTFVLVWTLLYGESC